MRTSRGHGHRRLRARAALAALAVLAASLAGAVGAPAPAEAAATDATCGFATPGSGMFDTTLCWIDLSGYDASAAASAAGQEMLVAIPGGYTLAFRLHIVEGAPVATAFPTWSGSFLGNGGYTGVPGKPALYQSVDSRTTTAEILAPVLKDSAGTEQSGFQLVGADAESTDGGESITWTSSAPIVSLTELPGGDPGIGNACRGGFTGIGTARVTCTGPGGAPKTGTAIVASPQPSFFRQVMVGGGKQAVAFGVLISSVQLQKVVVDGFDGDDFDIDISREGSSIAGANTNGTGKADTGIQTVVVAGNGTEFVLGESATSGSLANYDTSWSCTRNGLPDPSLPGEDYHEPQATALVQVGDEVACTIRNVAKDASLELEKTAGVPVDVNRNGITDAGDLVPYSFTATNTGELDLVDLEVIDPLLGEVVCLATTLEPEASTECGPVAYTVTAADEVARKVENTAVAEASPPGSTARIPSNEATTTTPVERAAPALGLVKSVAVIEVFSAGEVARYTFVVTNTGNVPVSSVTVSEVAFSGTGPHPVIECPAEPAVLAPGDDLECTATYTVTQDDVDAGDVTNTAVASGVAVGPGGTVASNQADASLEFVPAPAITLVKTAVPVTATAAGQTVTYTYRVRNTGNVTVSGVAVAEDLGEFTGNGTPPVPECPNVAIAPGAHVDCTASYVLTQVDVDRGSVSNTASASATPVSGGAVGFAPSTALVTIAADAELTVEKSGAVRPPGTGVAGDVVDYELVVVNTGNVTISDIAALESEFTGEGSLALVCPSTAIAPRESITCEGSYTLTQQDVDDGVVSNTAYATGRPPAGGTATSDESTAEVATDRRPALELVKTADPTSVAAAGETVRYTFLLTNAGTVTLSSPTIDEVVFSGTGELSDVACPETEQIAPGESMECWAIYTTSQDDIDSAAISNTARASAEPPPSLDPPTAESSTVIVIAIPDPGIALVKSVDTTELTHAGQLVEYAFEISNTGNVTLSDVGVDEIDFSGTGELDLSDCEPAAEQLPPGERVTCVGRYTVTQADVDGTGISNTAAAHGTPPGTDEPIASEESTTEESVSVHEPALALAKTATPDRAGEAGAVIRYAFTVTNTGNVTLTDLRVVEHWFGGAGTAPAPVCPAASLAPGEQTVCTADYTVVAADLTGIPFGNLALATASDPDGGRVESDPASAFVATTPALAATGVGIGAAALAAGLILLGLLALARRRRA